jgi:ATP synthase protein I
MSAKPPEDESLRHIARHVSRKQAERDNPTPNPLRGFSTFGMIGWSISVPTVGGAFLGMWLDQTMPQAFSWTIALILGGVAIGALIAWAWIGKEDGR